MKKIKVAILYGGRSTEHEISLKSAASVFKHIDKRKFDILPVAITKEGHWLINVFDKLSFDDTVPVKTKQSKPLFITEKIFNAENFFCDVIFPVVHGVFAEDGTLQGLLEMLNIPYVGANVLGSAIGMDKVIAKQLAAANNISVVPFIAFNTGEWLADSEFFQQQIKKKLGYPVFVKPVNAGSSLGITKVKNQVDLAAAINLAGKYDVKILVEQALEVREIEVAVLENLTFGQKAHVSVPGEIVVQHEFYSYEAKYIDKKGAQLVIPAVLEKKQTKELINLAEHIFNYLSCEGMARIDFFLEKSTQRIYFNEINTIPGFTNVSMYPKLWEKSGLTYEKLLSHLIDLALLRKKRLSFLKQNQ